jgi:hypothetical protein
MHSLTTTTARIDACNPCQVRRQRAAELLNITKPSDEPITYAQLLDVFGLGDALWCCRAEPDLAPIWRRYAVWCARQVAHLMTDQRSLDALDVAERHASGAATDEELGAALAAADAVADAVADAALAADAARAAARIAAWAAADAARAAAGTAAWAAAGAARAAASGAAREAQAAAGGAAGGAAREAAREAQAAAFRRLVTTGALD